MTFVANVLGNIVANVCFWVLLGAVFWFASAVARRRFVRFFGISEVGRVTVFLSNLWDGTRSRRSVGFIISKHELWASQAIVALLAAAPLRLPEVVRGLVDAVWLHGPLRCVVDVSGPGPERALAQSGATIIVGASRRNSVRRYFIENSVPHAILLHETVGGKDVLSEDVDRIWIDRSNGERQIIQSNLLLAVVEKVRSDHQGTLFFCVGARADGTRGAVEYLARNWKTLEREFRTDPFVVCLGFPKFDDYPDGYTSPTVLAKVKP